MGPQDPLQLDFGSGHAEQAQRQDPAQACHAVAVTGNVEDRLVVAVVLGHGDDECGFAANERVVALQQRSGIRGSDCRWCLTGAEWVLGSGAYLLGGEGGLHRRGDRIWITALGGSELKEQEDGRGDAGQTASDPAHPVCGCADRCAVAATGGGSQNSNRPSVGSVDGTPKAMAGGSLAGGQLPHAHGVRDSGGP